MTDKAMFSYIISRFFRIYLPGERGFSENTIASYRDAFKQFFNYYKDVYGIPPEKLKVSDFSSGVVIGFLAKLEADGKSVSTRNQRLAALKSFFSFVKFAYPEYLDIASSILAIHMKKQQEPTIGYMSVEGVTCLLQQPDARTRAGYRDMLILTLLYDSGARVSEIINIHIGDIRVQSPATVILHGKGSKDRIIPLSEKTLALIKFYLDSENLSRPECRNKLLFVNHCGEQLTRAGAAYILHKYVDAARVTEPTLIPDRFSPHCMRHSKAMHLLQAGVALIYIRDFLGHNSIATTEVYAKADSKTKRIALDMAYSDLYLSDPTLTASWNDDASLMRFLENLCAK